MNLFKRIEVIVLLVLAGAGAAFVLLTARSDDQDDATPRDADVATGMGTGALDAVNKLHRCTLERDYGNARLDIELRLANRGTKRLVMQPPAVKLLTDAGREVPPFFLPIEPPPEIPAGATQDVRLRYWLEKADLSAGLKLVIGDESLVVKSSAPFDLETLKTKEPKTFSGADWTP